MKTWAQCLCAAILLSFGNFGPADADTVFDITGNSSYSGTVTIDTVLGHITSAHVVVPTASPQDFTNIIPTPTQGPTTITASFGNGTVAPIAIIVLIIEDGGTLVGFTGGAIDDALFFGFCGLTGLCIGPPGHLGAGELTTQSIATPLPSTILLLTTGLVGLGLLGWRRKRRAAA